MTGASETVYVAVGVRLRRIREALGLNQAEMAKRIKLTRTSVTNIEAGRQRIQLHQIERIAAALITTPKHLLKGVWW